MRIQVRLKRYATLQCCLSLVICFILTILVSILYPALIPKFTSNIHGSGAISWTGLTFTLIVALYDLKHSGDGAWAFDRTILTIMIGYIVIDISMESILAFSQWLEGPGSRIEPWMKDKRLADIYEHTQNAPFNLLSGLFCGVTIVLVNRIILACSRFIARRKGVAS